MATTVGTLEFQFIADLARLKSDMAEVKRSVGSTASFIESSASTAKNALAGIASGLSVAAFSGWIKSAIDAGDATKEFSQKTGVAAKDVAGLQLAFKQGGVEGDALASAIAKLAKNMAAGSEAFGQLGVSVRNSDGTLREVKDVLADVADATARMGDGAGKSALLQQVLGKSAAALIPTLNEGGAGMRAMADEAERLGLVIDSEAAEASDKFNDTLGLLGGSVQGVGRNIASGILPSLQNLAEQLLQLITNGSGASGIVTGLSAVFNGMAAAVKFVSDNLGGIITAVETLAGAFAGKLIFSMVETIAKMNLLTATTGILNRVLTALGGPVGLLFVVAGALVGYFASLDTTAEKTKKLTTETDKLRLGLDGLNKIQAQSRLFQVGDEIQKTTETLVDIQSKMGQYRNIVNSNAAYKDPEAPRVLAELTAQEDTLNRTLRDQFGIRGKLIEIINAATVAKKEETKPTKNIVVLTAEQIAAIKSATSAYESYRDKLLSYRTDLQQTIDGGEKAGAAQKALAELTANNTTSVMKMTKERRAELIEIAKQNVALEKTAVARDAETKAIAKAMDEIQGKNASLKEEIAAQQSANEQARGGADASGLLAIAKLREAAATAERTAAITLETTGNQALADQYREQAALLRELADQKGQSVEIDRARQAAEEWKKTTDSIGQSLTDALLRGFESGAKFADVFKTTLINMFQTLVLRPIIQPIVQGAAGLLTGALGLSANASGGPGGGLGGLSSLSSLSSIYKAGTLLPGVQSTAFSQLGNLAMQPGILGDIGLAGSNYVGALSQAPGGLVGGGLLSAGAGFAGGALGNAVFGGGGQANTGAMVGGLVGSVVGSAFPLIGTYIGSALGSFLGSGIGSMFGNDKTPRTQFTTLGAGGDLGTLQDYNKLNPKGRGGETFAESAFGIIGLGGRTRQVDAQDFKETFDAIAAIDNALAAALKPDEITKVQAALKGFTSGVNASAAEYTRDRLIVVAKSIDETMGKIVSGFKGGAEDLASLTQSLAIVRRYSSADLGAQIETMIADTANANKSMFESWQSSSAQLADLASGFDGSLAMATQLAGVTQSTYQMELALIAQIQQALTQTHAMFGATIDQIKLSVLDTAGQYEFLRSRSDDLNKALATAVDPQQITQLAGQINAITQQAYGLLDATQKQAAAPEFVQYLNDVDRITTERLTASQDQIVANHQSMADAIETAMTRVADKMAAAADSNNVAADKMGSAANTFLAASGQPIQISINPLAGGEISYA